MNDATSTAAQRDRAWREYEREWHGQPVRVTAQVADVVEEAGGRVRVAIEWSTYTSTVWFTAEEDRRRLVTVNRGKPITFEGTLAAQGPGLPGFDNARLTR